MSRPTLCASCEMGDHDRHVRDWNIRPGLIGGDYCPCTDAAQCAADGKARLQRFWDQLGLKPGEAS